MLSWATLSQADFDRTVELLIVRWYQRNHPILTVNAIDGRGGDGGIDLDVRESNTGQLVKIYQLKFFPEGFSGGHGRRKQQIRRSFERVKELAPPTWALVIPRNFTIGERKWTETLVQDTGIQLEIVGQAELDSFQASDPHAVSLAERTAHKDALEIVRRESAALVTSEDLDAEISRLSARMDTLSPNWGVHFAAEGKTIAKSFYAKHPNAVEREPLSIKISLNFTDNLDLQHDFDVAIRYGVTEEIILPSSVVKRFERVGPDWFAESSAGGTLKLQPSENTKIKLPTILRVKSQENAVQVLRGTTTQVAHGDDGAIVRTEFGGGLNIRWRFARHHDRGASAAVAFTPKGHAALDVHRSLQTLDALHNGATVELQLNKEKVPLALGSHDQPGVSPAVVELADDLAVIERLTGTQFGFPDAFGPGVRVWARVVRRLLEGDCVIAPQMRNLDLVFDGRLDEGLESLLERPSSVVASVPNWTVELCGEELVVGDISYYHPCARIEDSARHLAALRAGKGTDRIGRLVPDDVKVGFRLYLPSKFRHETVTPVLWNLTDIKEHPEFGSPELDRNS